MADILDAIIEIDENAKVTVQGSDLNECEIQWHDNNPNEITKEQIESKLAEMETQFENNEYQRERASAYPSLRDFAEAYCEKQILGMDEKWNVYVEKYNAVRAEFPKP
jgi:hypothetical protein